MSRADRIVESSFTSGDEAMKEILSSLSRAHSKCFQLQDAVKGKVQGVRNAADTAKRGGDHQEAKELEAEANNLESACRGPWEDMKNGILDATKAFERLEKALKGKQ